MKLHSSLSIVTFFIIGCICDDPRGVHLTRHRRYLLYPDGDPARIQMILGLGLPLELEDESVTIGYVIKILYHIPQNSTDYTVVAYNAVANARSERMVNIKNEEDETEFERIKSKFLEEEKLKSDRNIAYSEGGKIEMNKELDEEYLDQILEEKRREDLLNRQHITRWDIYKVLENMIEQNGFDGRPCMLRMICEAADTPFTYRNGILGELAHILLTPSTSNDILSEHSDNEYYAAERHGSESSDCNHLFRECRHSILDMFSQVDFPSSFE